jgi:hypothetical protein
MTSKIVAMTPKIIAIPILIAALLICNQLSAQSKASGDSKSTTPTPPSLVQRFQPPPYVPVSKELYDTVAYMDSIYFDTYNTCNLEKMASLMADTMEFYHDKGGLTTSKKDFMEAIQHNICGKVNRRLVPGSLEVYPIHNYGAVLIGYHQFFNHEEPANGWSKPDKYIAIWRNQGGKWQLTRVVSLH